MREIQLQAVPNQRITVMLDGRAWDIELKTCQAHMAASLRRDAEIILLGQRVVCGSMIIPYRHLAVTGNFVIMSSNDRCIDWRAFGVSQSMFYLSPEEIPA